MLTLDKIQLRRGSRLLLEHGSAAIFPGQNVGVTGANGSGKSSLFALLLGELQADAGEVSVPDNWVIAHVAQQTPASDASALDYALDGDRELRAVERELRHAERERQGLRVAELHARYDAIGGYAATARAARLLAGLGFSDDQQQLPVRQFSGGWRMRLNLAQALLCRSDLLLLDEPTNHLDLDAVLWLEQWLRDYAGTLLLISHDRDFLDAVVDRVAHLEHQGLTLYSGNYSAFEQQRAERRQQQQATFAKQQQQVAHLNQFIDRFRAKASKARQAQSRLKALQKLEQITPAHVDSPFRFAFRTPLALPDPLLGLDQVAAGYDEQPVLQRLRLTLQPGSRIGLLGANGAGKSTLIKLLAGRLAPLAGERREAKELRVGYFAQHQLEQLRAERSPLQHLQALDGDAREQTLRDFLGGFGFAGDSALADVGPLSGGEKARLALALLVWQRPNLLLLDEPTNHLDLMMRHALNVALQDYQGALVVVSHDRHLLRTVSDEFWLVDDGRATRYDGDLDDYRAWLMRRNRGRGDPHRGGDADTRAGRRPLAAPRDVAAQRKPLRNELKKLDARLNELSDTKRRIEQTLADPELYRDDAKADLQTLLKQQHDVSAELEDVENRWLAAQERLDALDAEHSPTTPST